jgi:hypothetical protein
LPSCEQLEDVSDLAVGDLDGDDKPEIVFGSLKIAKSPALYILRRDAQGAWGCPEPFEVSKPVTRVAIVSLERGLPVIVAASTCDGSPCLLKVEAKAGSKPTELFRNDGAPGAEANDFRIADLDQNGALDIAITFTDLAKPSEAIAPVILMGKLGDKKGWTSNAHVLDTKISHSFALEVGPFAADGGLGVLFGGIAEGCSHGAKERQPVGVLALRDGASWKTHELETQATGKSDGPRWVIDLALGAKGAEVGAAAVHHCTGQKTAGKPFACSPDSRSELKAVSASDEAAAPRLLAAQSGEWKALAYLDPGHWALGFIETVGYLSGTHTKFTTDRGSVLLVDEAGAEPTTKIGGAALQIQDVATLSLRPRKEHDRIRVPAREGTQVMAYPLQFEPELSCGGKPTKVQSLTWVPESRLVTIPKLPSPCRNAELAYLADKHPAIVALDREENGVFISEYKQIKSKEQ